MMYTGNCLGTDWDATQGASDSAEAIRAAGLDWSVRKVPLYAIEGEALPMCHNITGSCPKIDGQADCPVFGIVGRIITLPERRCL